MTKPDLDPVDALREQFRAAAAQEIEAHDQAPKRRRSWFSGRALAIAAAVLVGTGGLATAGGLISIGEPKPDVKGKPAYLQPSSTPQVVLQADNPDGLPWGIAEYRDKAGHRCILVGYVRGADIGVQQNGTFRPYEDKTSGLCYGTDPAVPNPPAVGSDQAIDNVLLVYGLTRDDVARYRVGVSYEEYVTDVENGVFLFVFEDAAHSTVTQCETCGPLDAEGKLLRE